MPFPSPCFLSPFLLSLCPLFSLSPSCCHFPSQPPFLLCSQLPSLCFCKCHSPMQATTASRGVRFPSELQRQAVNLMELFPARPTLFMNASFTCLCAWSVGWMAFSLYPQRWLSSVAPRLTEVTCFSASRMRECEVRAQRFTEDTNMCDAPLSEDSVVSDTTTRWPP